MPYVRNAWYVALWSEDLVLGRPTSVKILGEPIVLWRGGGARAHALEDRCVHRFAPLSKGRCEGANLRCMYHGLLFGPDGKVVAIPGQDMIPSNAAVQSYPVVDRHGWIWIWMGDGTLADPSLIPTVFGTDDPAWVLGKGQLDYQAEARLINDNLTDFSHLAFVHATSFGTTATFAESLPKVVSMPRGVRFERWTVDEPPLGRPDSAGRFDSWMVYEYSIPGILHLVVKTFPAGTAKQHSHAGPSEALPPLRVTYSAQAVTPVSDGQARYLFSTGFPKPAPTTAVEFLMGVTLAAFAEDKNMIEAQQRIIDLDPGRRPMPTAADKGVTLFTRLVDRLARAEQADLALAASQT